MDDYLISVVIPVYNAEGFLRQCVESVMIQSDSNWELILVNDGSKDGSGKLCEELKLLDDRIRVHHQDNAGAAASRNRGAELARGLYIAYVDADDYLAADYLSYLRRLLTMGTARISCCGNVWTSSREESFVSARADEVRVLNAREAGASVIGPLGLQMLVPWGKLIPRELMLAYPFPEGRRAEDEATLYKVLYKAGGVIVGSRVCYAYYQNENSLMHNTNEKHRLDLLITMRERAEFFRNENEPEIADLMFGYYVNNMIADWANGHRDGCQDLKTVKVLPYLKTDISLLYRMNLLWWKLSGRNFIGWVDATRRKLHI